MEIACNRCRQTIQAENRYCPVCGLPQLVYAADGSPDQAQPGQWDNPVRNAGEIDWKPALRAAILMAVPAGLICPLLSPLGVLGWLVMAAASAWVVTLYVRAQRSAWITIGAGARIGMVTGMLGGWTAAGATGVALFAARFFFGQGKWFDDFWQNYVTQQMNDQWISMGVDAKTIDMMKAWMLSPEGRAGLVLAAIVVQMAALLLFAVAGGALGARVLARSRRPEV